MGEFNTHCKSLPGYALGWSPPFFPLHKWLRLYPIGRVVRQTCFVVSIITDNMFAVYLVTCPATIVPVLVHAAVALRSRAIHLAKPRVISNHFTGHRLQGVREGHSHVRRKWNIILSISSLVLPPGCLFFLQEHI